MSIAELEKHLDLPRRIELSREMWVAAAVLGLLRTAVNDEHRLATRDRGAANNILNDLQGSLGELVGLELLRRGGLNKGAQDLLDLNGSVDRPDLVATTDPQTLLDVKCHFDERRKRLFLVNEKARTRSINRGVVAFLPIVAAALHRDAYVGKFIPIKQLERWKLEVVGKYGDPSRQLPLSRLDIQFLGDRRISWRTEQLDEQWGPRVLEHHKLDQLQQTVGPSMLPRLRHIGFSLDGLTFIGARDALLGLLPQRLRTELGVN